MELGRIEFGLFKLSRHGDPLRCATHRWNLDFNDLLGVRLIIQAVAQKVSEVAKCPLNGVGNSFLLTLGWCW